VSGWDPAEGKDKRILVTSDGHLLVEVQAGEVGFEDGVEVDVGNWPAVQVVEVDNFPAVQEVDGDVGLLPGSEVLSAVRNTALDSGSVTWDGEVTERESADIVPSEGPEMLIYVDNGAAEQVTVALLHKVGTDSYVHYRDEAGVPIEFDVPANEEGVYGPFSGFKFEGGQLKFGTSAAPDSGEETSFTVQEV